MIEIPEKVVRAFKNTVKLVMIISFALLICLGFLVTVLNHPVIGIAIMILGIFLVALYIEYLT